MNTQKRYDLNALPEDRAGIMDMLAEVQAEIDDITAQLAEIEIDEDDPEDLSWAQRAEKARRFRFLVRAKLDQRLKGLGKADPAVSIQAQVEIARLRDQRAARNVAESREENKRKVSALRQFIAERAPHLAEEAQAVLTRVEIEVGAAHRTQEM